MPHSGFLPVEHQVFHPKALVQELQLLQHRVRSAAHDVVVLLELLEGLHVQRLESGAPGGDGRAGGGPVAHRRHVLPGAAQGGPHAPDEVPGLLVGLLLGIADVAAEQVAEIVRHRLATGRIGRLRVHAEQLLGNVQIGQECHVGVTMTARPLGGLR